MAQALNYPSIRDTLTDDHALRHLQTRLGAALRRLALPLLIALLIALPIALVAAELLTPSWDLWEHLASSVLPRMLLNTLLMMVGVGLGAGVIGVGLAWLVTAYEFPLRRVFERLLLLPLAVPSFVMGFVFMATFDYAGPIQSALRDLVGAAAVRQFFPNIRTPLGAIIVLTLVLYPYVYLLARAAFREQSAALLEAAQVMGLSRARAFWRLILPMARPSIVAGVTLAVMEAMTDFATVRFFSVPTISEGVVRIWTSGSASARGEATELAGLLLVMAVGLIVLERILRGRSRFFQPGGRARRLPRLPLTGVRAWAAGAVCAAILTCAFFIPVGQLVLWVINEVSIPGSSWQTVYGQYIGTSFGLSGAAAGITVVLALVLAQARRTASGRSLTIQRGVMRLATLGYALPGAVIAAGVLLTLSPLDHALHDLAALWGANLPLLLTGSITGLVYAYVVRFMSVAYNSVDASMQKIKPSLEGAARCMGAGRGRILWRIHAPLVSGGLAAGGLLVFVDVMKELPATLLLRPFGMDTLAVWTYMLAVESFWQAAALPALTILAVGLLPVVLLMRLR